MTFCGLPPPAILFPSLFVILNAVKNLCLKIPY